jgi:CheY-like chemotaxis protein
MNNPTILIVEKEAIVSMDISNKLQKLGYSVAGSTDNCEEAINLACQLHPSVVLMDSHLTGDMDGIATAGVIQEECNIPVVLLTTFSEKNILDRAAQWGISRFVTKPFEDSDLLTQVEMVLYNYTES